MHLLSPAVMIQKLRYTRIQGGAMRTLSGFVFVCFLLPAHPNRLSSQSGLSGCAVGRDVGFVTVTRSSELREISTGRVYSRVIRGDELRLCGIGGPAAAVTLWSAGIGYSLPAKAIGRPHLPTMRPLSEKESSCIAAAIVTIQRSNRSLQQGRAFLILSRHWRVTISQLLLVREDLIFSRVKPASEIDCVPDPRPDTPRALPDSTNAVGTRPPGAGPSTQVAPGMI